MTILQLATLVIKLVGSSSKITFLPALEEGDMARRCPDTRKMKAVLNGPLVPIEEGIMRLADFISSTDRRQGALRMVG
jgi:nucleoside-diphosphate-sugar epimerase